jgi:amidohydrolase
MSLKERLAISPEFDAWLRETRQLIHMNPELLCEEHETSALVQKHLTEVGVDFKAGVGGDGRSLYISQEVLDKAGIKTYPPTGGTGVLATITGTRGKGPGKTILLRADMDALPLEEVADVPYKSRVPGKMHACGHDLHTTVLMGVAEVLKGMTDTFDGTVKLMFQPGEEGAGGAAAMINDGILENPKVDAAVALHVSTAERAGEVSVSSGPRTAAADTFEIRITGKGGHAAAPHTTVDPTLVAAHIMIALQALVSRETNPFDTAVVTVGKLISGTVNNIIPQTAMLSGTVRTYNPEVRANIEKRMTEMAAGIAQGFGAEAETVYVHGYPPLFNDEEVSEHVRQVCVELFGEDKVKESGPIMAGEDMAFVGEKVPTCMFGLGVGNPEKGFIYPVHNPRFDADEDAIAVGVQAMAGIALRYLDADI